MPAKVEIYRGKATGGVHRARIRAANGRTMMATAEGYHNASERDDALFESCEALMRWWCERNPAGFAKTAMEVYEQYENAEQSGSGGA